MNAAKEMVSLYFISSTNIKICYYVCILCHFVKNCSTGDGRKEDKHMTGVTEWREKIKDNYWYTKFHCHFH